MSTAYHTIVIGGGFYGASIAAAIAEQGRRVLLVEREKDLLRRASLVNQARIHRGYHYPRSLQTARSSALNFARFLEDFRGAVASRSVKLYAIARQRSKVSAAQFVRFCGLIEAPIKPCRPAHARLFNPDLIEAAFEVEELAFDATVVRDVMRDRLRQLGVEVRLETEASGLSSEATQVHVDLSDGSRCDAEYAVNCTYSALASLPGLAPTSIPALKHELTELCLIDPPPELEGAAITVMDGPFFSVMQFPAEDCYTLTHVTYTPHFSWEQDGTPGVPSPDRVRRGYGRSHFARMQRDAARYVPCLARARHRRSIYEIKTVLPHNEIDDGRPILYRRSDAHGRVFSVLGSKLDNVYDVLSFIRKDLPCS